MNNQENSNKSIWDKVLSKYISIWLWSIIFGANATVTYRLSTMFPSREWGMLTLVPDIMLLYGLVLTFRSWTNLIKYFAVYIIPKFFPTDGEPIDELELNQHSKLLLQSLKFIMYAAFIAVLSTLAQLIIYSVLGKL